MRPVPALAPLASFTLLALLSACGGGTGGGTGKDAAEPDAAAASGGDGTGSAAGSRALSGRVADGYLRGARVCVDVDEDETCDADEPSAITGEGGRWTLELAPGQEGKPIVADIPATAVDEDTGEAIGRALLFTAPASRPDFLSPITTLVQQELRANPALDVAAAEQVVKSSLGLGGEDVSLFEDYVAGEREGDGDSPAAERFRYLHDTARVIASMMQDIEARVGEAAVARGHDVAAGSEAGRAVREIVREEVRDLLPAIAREVAMRIESESAAIGDGEGGATDGRFDPKRIAELLRPGDVAEGVDERIEAIRDREPPAAADLEVLLTAGVHWLDTDCEAGARDTGIEYGYAYEYEDEYGRPGTDPAPGSETPAERGGIAANGEASGESGERCRTVHGVARLDEARRLQTTEFAYDDGSGQWLEVTEDMGAPPPRFELALLDGEWVRHENGAPRGIVRFTEDGAAVVADTFGDTTLHGATRSLAGLPLLAHLHEGIADSDAFAGTRERFPEGSTVTRLKVLAAVPTHVLHVHPDADPGDGDCSEFGGNCNVVHALIDGVHVAQTSIDGIRASIGSGGLDVLGAGGATHDDPITVLRLATETSADGSLPSAGTVEWLGRSRDEGSHPDADRRAVPDEPRALMAMEAIGGPGDELASSAEMPPPEKRFASRWQLVEVDGIATIEIELPAALRFDDGDNEGDDDDGDDFGDGDHEDEADRALLFAEHAGFVRRGVRLSGRRVESVKVYDENAFDALRTVLETRLAGIDGER